MLDEARAIARALQGIQATMGWLELRGIKREDVLRILTIAEDAGRDVSEGEILQVLDATDTALLNLRQQIAMERGIGLFHVTAEDMVAAREAENAAKLAEEEAPTPSAKGKAKAKTPKEPTSDEIKAALDKVVKDAQK